MTEGFALLCYPCVDPRWQTYADVCWSGTVMRGIYIFVFLCQPCVLFVFHASSLDHWLARTGCLEWVFCLRSDFHVGRSFAWPIVFHFVVCRWYIVSSMFPVACIRKNICLSVIVIIVTGLWDALCRRFVSCVAACILSWSTGYQVMCIFVVRN